MRGLSDKAVTPLVDAVFPLDAVTEAYDYLDGEDRMGKVVPTMGDD